MEPVQIVAFEDGFVDRLGPIVAGRPAFAIACGGARLIDELLAWGAPVSAVVREHLAASIALDYPLQPRPQENGSPGRLAGPTLFVNAALAPAASVLDRLRRFARCERSGVVRWGGRIAASLCLKGCTPSRDALSVESLTARLAHLPDAGAVELPLFDDPHDVVKRHVQHMTENLERRVAERAYREHAEGVYLAENVEVGPFVSFDARQGPIVIESGATIGPHAALVGPIRVGSGSKILPHAALLGRVSLGETTKIGGEVEDSIVESYSNKQHYGFLGHSYVGSWVNLGAGTSNSDLKNTYGEVHMEVGGRRVSTGMQLLGCFLGDYVKSAVNTSIFTGKTVGPGSMLYGYVTANVPSFVNWAKSFDQVTEIPLDVAESVQARMFARRGKTPRPCDVALLRAMHARSQSERVEAAPTPVAW